MPIFSCHGICCRCCAECRAVFEARRERARYLAMTFAQRKAYRIAKQSAPERPS